MSLGTLSARTLVVLLAITSVHFCLTWWRDSGHWEPARIAFFIQVSPETMLSVPRLIKALHHPKNVYIVHFDNKIPMEWMSSVQRYFETDDFRNVFVLPSEPIAYAGVSMLLNTLNAISMALEHKWDFFINLSGSDYPLLSPDTIRRLLGNPSVLRERLNFLQAQEADKDREWFIDKRLRHLYLDTTLHSQSTKRDGILIDLNATNPTDFTDVPFVKSEAWVILHRSFCIYAASSTSGRRLLLSYATARAADELFFGTLLSQSEKFRPTMTWDSFRFIQWGLHETKWSRPGYLDELDGEIREELATSGAFFARKFRDSESSLLDFIDSNLSGVTDFDYRKNDSRISQFSAMAARRVRCAATFRSVTSGCYRGTPIRNDP
ncbi:Xylosyltransferase family GT14 [Gracilaria domingensis]|nr:Xylosyltransferase family GT14 [Gracilaria domingensis]